jgi:hypothetical protein
MLEDLCRIYLKWNPSDAVTKEVCGDYFVEVLHSNTLKHLVVEELATAQSTGKHYALLHVSISRALLHAQRLVGRYAEGSCH